jgi:RNA polymerase nonessential primary-like sigma factor
VTANLSLLGRQQRLAIAFRCCLQLLELERKSHKPVPARSASLVESNRFISDRTIASAGQKTFTAINEIDVELFERNHADDSDVDASYLGESANGNTVLTYLSSVKRIEQHSPAFELQLVERWRGGDIAARDSLIRATLWLVPVVVRRFAGNGIMFEDLVEEGNLALFEALDRFEPARGVRFSTYAKWWILKFAVNARRDQAYPLRVPRLNRTTSSTTSPSSPAEGDEDAAVWPSSCPPTTDASSTNVTLGELSAQSARRHPDFQLDSVTLEDAQIQLDQLSADAVAREFDSEVEEVVAVQQALHSVLGAVALLPERERLILQHRYGLGDEPIMTLQELGAMLGLSAEGVRKIQMAALNKLKTAVFPSL